MGYLDNTGLGYLWRKITSALESKQDKLAGTAGQVVGFNADGRPVAQAVPDTGVTAFNGRKGAVIPCAGDYTAQDILLPDGTDVGTLLSRKVEPLTKNQDIYVSNSGSDSAGDGTEARPYATIQHAVDSIPQNLGGHRNIIHVAAGTYPGARITGFYGGSYGNCAGIQIEGPEWIGKDNRPGVVISGSVECYSCDAYFSIVNVEIMGNRIGYNLAFHTSSDASVRKCVCSGTEAAGGILFERTHGTIYDTTVNDKTTSGVVIYGCMVFASLIKGENNAVCFQTGNRATGTSGILIGAKTPITGTTKYVKELGGIVFEDGVQV